MKKLRELLLITTVVTGIITTTTVAAYADDTLTNISSKTVKAISSAQILTSSLGKVSGTTISELPCTVTVKDLENSISVSDGYDFRILDKSKGSTVYNMDKYLNSKMVVAVNSLDDRDKVKEYKLKVVTEHKIIDTEIGSLSSKRLINIPRDTYTDELKAGLTVSNGAAVEVLNKSKGRVIKDEDEVKVAENMVVQVTGMDGEYTEYKIVPIKEEEDDSDPTRPKNVSTSDVTDSSVVLSWNASSDNVGVVGYDIYCNSKKKVSTTATSIEITDLEPDTIYEFKVRARDAAGNISYFSYVVTVRTADN